MYAIHVINGMLTQDRFNIIEAPQYLQIKYLLRSYIISAYYPFDPHAPKAMGLDLSDHHTCYVIFPHNGYPPEIKTLSSYIS